MSAVENHAPAKSELDVLGSLLGARIVNAAALESSVIERCDASVDLQKQRQELAHAKQEVCRLDGRQKLLSARAPSTVPGDAAELKRMPSEISTAQARCKALEERISQLEQRANQQFEMAHFGREIGTPHHHQPSPSSPHPSCEHTDLEDARSSAAAASVLPGGPSPALAALAAASATTSSLPRWQHLKAGGTTTTLLLDEDDNDDDEDDNDDDDETWDEDKDGDIAIGDCQTSEHQSNQPEMEAPNQASSGAASDTMSQNMNATTCLINGVIHRPPRASKEATSTKVSKAASAVAPAGARPSSKQKKDGGAAVSPKEFLSRFKSTKPEMSEKKAKQLEIASAIFRPSPNKASDAGSQQQATESAPNKADDDTAKLAMKGEGTVPIKQEAVEGTPPGGGESRKRYSIDVQQLVPGGAHVQDRWKNANPHEWEAALRQGEAVSPAQNLLQGKPGVKRSGANTYSDLKAHKRVRREDDTNQRMFEKRQAQWARSSRAPASELIPKQQVDADGSLSSAQEIPANEGGEDGLSSQLQDDVRVAEGLRCPRWLWEALYPYQHVCVKWLWGLHQERMGGLLADEMGLGKTIQIVAYLAVLHHSGVLQSMRVQNSSLGAASPLSVGGVLIVAPATLVPQWRAELNLWYPPLRVCVMHGVDQKERREAIRVASSEQGVLITSYETMRIAHDDLQEVTWVMMVLDEGQKIRNPHANITLAAKRFSTPHRIILSGSPIQNNLKELWSLFDFICPGRLGTLPVFMEEFAIPIEQGNLAGANQTRVATAYQCALAIRELTQPCILRRTKAECMDVLRLPAKSEQVLFCHLTPEQYQVYVDFLQSEQVRRAMSSSRDKDKKKTGSIFFALMVLRKLCNHPDLLLRDADSEVQPPDMWNPERSGKMKVLGEIMRLWLKEGHRALIFVQTIQMIEVIEAWMNAIGYTHLRIDGKTPVKRRLTMIEEFNANADIFAMILTTRVGGVGLNIIGADRVVIFDPDWNPMTDVQARERTWRIGQRKDVAVYRLVLAGSIEEKVYQRQVYKHFLSQKILNDPRQRQFFKWNDVADLFDLPPMPPDFKPEDMVALREKYKQLFKKFDKRDVDDVLGDGESETTELMQSISNLPSREHNLPGKESTEEHNAILQTLFDSNGIKASFNHDKVEQPLLDRKIIREGASMIAQRALEALARSGRERANQLLNEPTWTGQRSETTRGRGVKREPGSSSSGNPLSHVGALSTASGVSSADILNGLKQLAAIRSTVNDNGQRAIVPMEKLEKLDEAPDLQGLPTELHKSDRKIAEFILQTFLNEKLAGKDRCLTTDQVLRYLASQVAAHHSDLFKTLLRQLCELSKSGSRKPGVWTLRREFWPKPAARESRSGK